MKRYSCFIVFLKNTKTVIWLLCVSYNKLNTCALFKIL